MADNDFFGGDSGDGGGLNTGGSGDSYVEETTTGWLQRITGSVLGILLGILFVLGAAVLLFWNEGRTIKNTRALQEAGKVFVALDKPVADPANNGKLVYTAGEAQTEEVLTDKPFGVSLKAVRLQRLVEMFQWKEQEKSESSNNLGGSTTTRKTYTYKKVWSEEVIDSHAFKKPEEHANPTQIPLRKQDLWARQVRLGGFTLPQSLLQELNNYEAVLPDPGALGSLPAPFKDRAQVLDEWVYLGNPQTPAVGDMRVKFQAIKPGPVSVVARQVGTSFEPYAAQSGKSVQILQAGIHSPEGLLAQAQSENILIAWLVRAGGAILMFLGIYFVFRPLAVVLDVLPFLGDLADAGIGIFSFVLGLVLSLAVIAVAWFTYRPALSVGLVAAGVVLLFLARKIRQGHRSPGAA